MTESLIMKEILQLGKSIARTEQKLDSHHEATQAKFEENKATLNEFKNDINLAVKKNTDDLIDQDKRLSEVEGWPKKIKLMIAVWSSGAAITGSGLGYYVAKLLHIVP